MSESPVERGRSAATENPSRKELLQLVSELVLYFDMLQLQQPTPPQTDTPPESVPSPVEVYLTQVGRVFLGPEANRHYTADEARALAAELLRVAASAR